MRNDLCRRNMPKGCTSIQVHSTGVSIKETCRIKIARTGGVDHLGNGLRWHFYHSIFSDHNRTMFATSNGSNNAVLTQLSDSKFKGIGFIER